MEVTIAVVMKIPKNRHFSRKIDVLSRIASCRSVLLRAGTRLNLLIEARPKSPITQPSFNNMRLPYGEFASAAKEPSVNVAKYVPAAASTTTGMIASLPNFSAR